MLKYQFDDDVEVPVSKGMLLPGRLTIPENAEAIVIFAHGSGSSRFSPRNQYVAQKLQEKHYATLLFDLLTLEENKEYFYRFQVDFLAKRLVQATQWIANEILTSNMAIGYFGASTGAAAALTAASEMPDKIDAVVSRGGRPDLASAAALHRVQSAVMLIVGGNDEVVIDLNRKAYEQLDMPKELIIIPEATHLFEEPGKLEEVTDCAIGWFGKYLKTEVPL